MCCFVKVPTEGWLTVLSVSYETILYEKIKCKSKCRERVHLHIIMKYKHFDNLITFIEFLHIEVDMLKHDLLTIILSIFEE